MEGKPAAGSTSGGSAAYPGARPCALTQTTAPCGRAEQQRAEKNQSAREAAGRFAHATDRVWPANPARFPNELISAMAPAAAVPVRKRWATTRTPAPRSRCPRQQHSAQSRRATVNARTHSRSFPVRRRTPALQRATALARAVGMRTDDHHRHRGDHIRNRRNQRHLHVAEAGQRLNDLRRPEADAVEPDDRT